MLSLFLLDDEFEFFNFKNRHSNFMYVLTMDFYYRVILLTGSALKVLSVGDDKISTIKVKVKVSLTQTFPF